MKFFIDMQETSFEKNVNLKHNLLVKNLYVFFLHLNSPKDQMIGLTQCMRCRVYNDGLTEALNFIEA